MEDPEPAGLQDGVLPWARADSLAVAWPVDGVVDDATVFLLRESRGGLGGDSRGDRVLIPASITSRQPNEYYSSVFPGGAVRRPRECFETAAHEVY